jgi:excisionase family DNA binding protein
MIREEQRIEELLTLKELKQILGVSVGVVLGLVRDGRIRAWKVTGQPVGKQEIDDGTYGLRFRPSDVREFLNGAEVR